MFGRFGNARQPPTKGSNMIDIFFSTIQGIISGVASIFQTKFSGLEQLSSAFTEAL